MGVLKRHMEVSTKYGYPQPLVFPCVSTEMDDKNGLPPKPGNLHMAMDQ